jgi:hypothetical protein
VVRLIGVSRSSRVVGLPQPSRIVGTIDREYYANAGSVSAWRRGSPWENLRAQARRRSKNLRVSRTRAMRSLRLPTVQTGPLQGTRGDVHAANDRQPADPTQGGRNGELEVLARHELREATVQLTLEPRLASSFGIREVKAEQWGKLLKP